MDGWRDAGKAEEGQPRRSVNIKAENNTVLQGWHLQNTVAGVLAQAEHFDNVGVVQSAQNLNLSAMQDRHGTSPTKRLVVRRSRLDH
jgi:hypothetical protein